MTTALTTIAPKLSKLVALLSSDKDGEVLAAVRALGRTLKQAGADFNDLAATVARAKQPDTRFVPNWQSCRNRTKPPLAWRDIADSEQAGWLARMSTSRLLSAWEQDFCASIMVQVKFRPWSRLSPKQADILDRCMSKIAETRRKGAAA